MSQDVSLGELELVGLAAKFWVDHNGKAWPVPQIRGRLKFRIPSHAALRAFVFRRDNYACQNCGAQAADPGPSYDGRGAVSLPGRRWCLVMDHVVSRRNGGVHHPDNLRTYCDTCNSAKAGLIDAKGPSGGMS